MSHSARLRAVATHAAARCCSSKPIRFPAASVMSCWRWSHDDLTLPGDDEVIDRAGKARGQMRAKLRLTQAPVRRACPPYQQPNSSSRAATAGESQDARPPPARAASPTGWTGGPGVRTGLARSRNRLRRSRCRGRRDSPGVRSARPPAQGARRCWWRG